MRGWSAVCEMLLLATFRLRLRRRQEARGGVKVPLNSTSTYRRIGRVGAGARV